MTQLSFTDIPAARNTDPDTSHEAVANHTGRETHAIKVWWAVKENPGRTYRELARIVGLDEVEVMRRLNDLHRKRLVSKGPIRACSTNQHRMCTWILTGV